MSDGTLVYDDACGFCTWWAQYLSNNSELTLVGFSEITDAQRARLPDGWEGGAHLLTDGEVYSFGAAIEQALLRSEVAPEGSDEVVRFLRQFRDYDRLRERLYHEVADRRDVLGQIIRADTTDDRN